VIPVFLNLISFLPLLLFWSCLFILSSTLLHTIYHRREGALTHPHAHTHTHTIKVSVCVFVSPIVTIYIFLIFLLPVFSCRTPFTSLLAVFPFSFTLILLSLFLISTSFLCSSLTAPTPLHLLFIWRLMLFPLPPRYFLPTFSRYLWTSTFSLLVVVVVACLSFADVFFHLLSSFVSPLSPSLFPSLPLLPPSPPYCPITRPAISCLFLPLVPPPSRHHYLPWKTPKMFSICPSSSSSSPPFSPSVRAMHRGKKKGSNTEWPFPPSFSSSSLPSMSWLPSLHPSIQAPRERQ